MTRAGTVPVNLIVTELHTRLSHGKSKKRGGGTRVKESGREKNVNRTLQMTEKLN
jgi:hypothetical protein